MARVSKQSWILVLLTVLQFIFLYTIQISSGAYVEQFLESVEVCTTGAMGPFSSLAKKKIRLSNFPNRTVMLKMTRWEQFWPSFLNFRCKFQVIAPKKSGVMVVIQAMHLRTNPSKTACRDFIKFEQDDGFKSGKICGDLDSSDLSASPSGIIGPRYFHDNRGEIDVSFSTDDKDGDDHTAMKPVFLKMIFTAYSECSSIEQSMGKVKRCSSLQSQSCIPSELICDGEVNCGITDQDFGADEQDCDGHKRTFPPSTDAGAYNSINVFTITWIVTSLLVIIMVLLACCCMRKCVHGRRHPDLNPPFQEHIDLRMEGISTTEFTEKPTETVLNAPPDLPPSYDALFPTSSGSKKSEKQ